MTTNGDGLAQLTCLVLAEASRFPDLAASWYDDMLTPLIDILSDGIARAQRDGHVLPGDPRLTGLSILSAILCSPYWSEFSLTEPVSTKEVRSYAIRQIEVILEGLVVREPAP